MSASFATCLKQVLYINDVAQVFLNAVAIIFEQHDTSTTVWVEGLMISPKHAKLNLTILFRHTLLISPPKIVKMFEQIKTVCDNLMV